MGCFDDCQKIKYNENRGTFMKKTLRKAMAVIFILFISLSSFSGCVDLTTFHTHDFKQKMDGTKHFKECSCGEIKDSAEHEFSWRKDYTGKECTACGYIIDGKTPVLIEKNEDGTIKLKEELISTLIWYFKNYRFIGDPFPWNFADKLNLIKSGECSPLLVKFSNECYYVAAYYAIPEGHCETYCCCDNYTWVGVEKVEDVKEIWDGKTLVGAFQINPQELCVNIKTGSTDVVMDHFAFYTPEFVDDVAVAPEIILEDLFIYLNWRSDKYIGYSSLRSPTHHKYGSIKCMEFDGKYYVAEYHGSVYSGVDLEEIYGKYYDELMSNIVDEYVVEDDNRTRYGLFELEDIVKIIK